MGWDFIQKEVTDFRKILDGYLTKTDYKFKKYGISLVNAILFRGDVVLHLLLSPSPSLPV